MQILLEMLRQLNVNLALIMLTMFYFNVDLVVEDLNALAALLVMLPLLRWNYVVFGIDVILNDWNAMALRPVYVYLIDKYLP